MLTILDVLIGVIVVYLVLSLMVSAATEWVASALKLRARTLQQGISRLLDPPGEIATPRLTAAQHVTPSAPARPGEPTREFYRHPLITALSSRAHPPSYVPASVFAEVAEQLLATGRVPATAPVHAVAAQVRSVGAMGDPRTRLETLFNDTMERATGWYKRLAQAITLAIAATVTVLANADTLQLTHVLWTSRTAREAAVARAGQLAARPAPAAIDAGFPQSGPPPAGEAAEDVARSAEEEVEEAPEETAADAQLLGQLIGWGADYKKINAPHCRAIETRRDEVCGDPKRGDECRSLLDAIAREGRCAIVGSHLEATATFPGGNFLRGSFLAPVVAPHLLGWLLTIAAISFGAAFWFDTLNRFLNIRGAGRAPDEGNKGAKKGAGR